MDMPRLRFGEFNGDRLSVRVAHRDRQKLRRVARELGMSESELVREGVQVVISALAQEPVRPDPHLVVGVPET